MSKHQKMKRPKGILYDFDGDCRFPNERVKGFWKRYFTRWWKRKQQRDDIRDYSE